MKKAIILILISLGGTLKSEAQVPKIDTVLIRENTTLQAQDWAFLVGTITNTDSTSAVQLRRIRSIARDIPSINWTTPVSVDSLPGYILMYFYTTVKQGSSAGEIAARYTAITNEISSKTSLAYFVGLVDAQCEAAFQAKRKNGKAVILDN